MKPLRRVILLCTLTLAATLAACETVAPAKRVGLDHLPAIEQVVSSFGRAIKEKNKSLYMSLFYSSRPEEVGWQHVSEDVRLAQIRRTKPDAIKARRLPGNNFVSLIDEVVGTSESREEKFFNVKIDTDGEIASVMFDYEFYAAGKKTNWGKEHWQLVRTEAGWKIFSVVYTIRDDLSGGA